MTQPGTPPAPGAGIAPLPEPPLMTLFIRLEWLLLLSIVAAVVLIYPLRLDNSMLLALGDYWRGSDSWFSVWSRTQLEPILQFLFSPLILKGVAAGILMTLFLAVHVTLRCMGYRSPARAGRPASGERGAWLCIAALAVWMIVGQYYSPTPALARQAAYWIYFLAVFLFVLMRRGFTDPERSQLGALMILIGFPVALIVILQALDQQGQFIFKFFYRFDDQRNRFGSLMGHNSAAASFLLMSAFPALAFVVRSPKSWVRIGCLVYLLLCVFSWLLLQSRAIWLLAPILLGLAIWRSLRAAGHLGAQRWLPTVMLAMLILALLSQAIDKPWNPLYVRSKPLSERLHDVSPEGLAQESRLRLNLLGLQLALEKPILGHGLYSFQYVYPKFQGEYFNAHPDSPLNRTISRSHMAHNDYLQLFIDHGLIGLALGLWVIATVFRRGLRSIRNRPPGEDALMHAAFGWAGLGFLLHALMDFPFNIPQLLFPGLICLAAWAGGVARDPIRAEDASFEPTSSARTLRLASGLLAIGLVPILTIPQGLMLASDIKYVRGNGLLNVVYLEPDADPQYKADSLKDAVGNLSQAVKILPANHMAALKLADAYFNQAKLARWDAEGERRQGMAEFGSSTRRARELYRRSIEVLDHAAQGLDFHSVYYIRGLIYQDWMELEPQPQPELAEGFMRNMQMSLRYNPQYANPAYYMAEFLARQSSPQIEKITQLRRLVKKENRYLFDSQYIFRANRYLLNGEYQNARNAWLQILPVEPDNDLWLAAAVNASFMAGDHATMRQLLDRLGRLNPTSLLLDMGLLLEALKPQPDPLQFLICLDRIRTDDPINQAFYRALEIESALRAEDFQHKDLVGYPKPPQLDEDYWRTMVAEFRLVVLHRYLKDFDAARQSIQDRLAMPSSPSHIFWVDVAYFALDAGDRELLQRALDRLRDTKPGHSELRFLEPRLSAVPDSN